jgi:hypothetical protein
MCVSKSSIQIVGDEIRGVLYALNPSLLRPPFGGRNPRISRLPEALPFGSLAPG